MYEPGGLASELVKSYIDAYLYKDAIFLAERLHVSQPKNDTLHLLAYAHFRAGSASKAYQLLESSKHPQSMLLCAQCAVQLDQLTNAEQKLRLLIDMEGLLLVEKASLYSMLASILIKTGRSAEAEQFFNLSLKFSPFLWNSYQELLDGGHSVTGPSTRIQEGLVLAQELTSMQLVNVKNTPENLNPGPFKQEPTNDKRAEERKQSRSASSEFRMAKRPTTSLSSVISDSNRTLRSSMQMPLSNIPPESPRMTRAKSKTFKKEEMGESTDNIYTVMRHSVHTLLKLLNSFFVGYQHLANFNGYKAIEVFESLPQEQSQSSWILSLICRAYFEMNLYKQADQSFHQLRKCHPNELTLVAIHSTVLWHLKKSAELAHIAHSSMSLDKKCPETWVAVGNSFSLKKERTKAIQCFERAIQLDPYFTYAYTLIGHEYVAIEEYVKATSYYRHAIQISPRHYNAWYGLGMVFSKQEKYSMAEYHWTQALKINPNSSIIMCHLGMLYQKAGHLNRALDLYEQALCLTPDHSLVLFRKASILMSMNRDEEAMEILNAIRASSDRESNVYIMMGKIFQKMDRATDAVWAYTMAQDASNKQSVKDAIESIHSVKSNNIMEDVNEMLKFLE